MTTLTLSTASALSNLFPSVKPGHIRNGEEHNRAHIEVAKNVLAEQKVAPSVSEDLGRALCAIDKICNGGTIEEKGAAITTLNSVLGSLDQASDILRAYKKSSHEVKPPARELLLDWHDMHLGTKHQPNSVAGCCPPIQDVVTLAAKVQGIAEAVRRNLKPVSKAKQHALAL
ncbi:MAG: hypothetical protein AB7S81_06110 [Bdellovibrionales bacterium]